MFVDPNTKCAVDTTESQRTGGFEILIVCGAESIAMFDCAAPRIRLSRRRRCSVMLLALRLNEVSKHLLFR